MKERASVKGIVVGLACSALLSMGCARTLGPRSIPTSLPTFGDVAVPQIVGMPMEAALEEVGVANLVPRIEYDPKASPAGVVIRIAPAAGETVPLTSIVDLVVAGDRGEPHVETGIDAGLSPMGELVGLYPEVFLGLDVLDDVPVFVFNPGIDENEWMDELEWAARGRAYRTKSCSVSLLELRQVQAGLSLRSWWTDRDFGFGILLAPARCQVWLMTYPLTPAERSALREAYGDLVWIDERGGAEPG
jgi:hypothetical protein